MRKPRRPNVADFLAEKAAREGGAAPAADDSKPEPSDFQFPDEYIFHPLTEELPPLAEAEQQALTNDIKVHGQREPIMRDRDGVILTGRHRLKACLMAGIKPRFDTYEGDDPIAVIVSSDLIRRHLSESQRAMAAAKLANMRQGERTDLEPSANLPEEAISQAAAAARLNVSERSIRHAGVVRKRGTPELIRAVEQGEVSVSAAAKQAKPKPWNMGPLPIPPAIDVAAIKSAFKPVETAMGMFVVQAAVSLKEARREARRLRPLVRNFLRTINEALKR
jgi:ParB-like chromosome segregation protein Spo0J